ncbi:MAG: VanZ family protein [Clostridia bacterium]|nr:VanZ family protein [Clostridia bacterium]
MRIFRTATVIILVLWCVLIFALSSENAALSSETSGKFTEAVIDVIYSDFEDMDVAKQEVITHNVTFVIRKLAHFTIFALLGVFALASIVSYSKPSFALKSLFSAAFCLLYAISDEIHQLFVAGRSGEIRDVIIDFLGSLLGIIFISLIFKKNRFFNAFVGGTNA